MQSSFLPVVIMGTGHSLPAQTVDSSDLDASLGLAPHTLQRATGVERRYHAVNETQIDLACAAAHGAMKQACLEPRDIDLIISACGVGYQTIPSTAPLIQRTLGIADGAAAAFDINSTCLSFLTAFDMAARLVVAGQHRRALVVSAELASRALPWTTQPEVAALFGDGAGAAILGAADNATCGIVASLMQTFPSAYEACEIGAGGTRFDFKKQLPAFADHSTFSMDGRALLRITFRHFNAFIETLLARAGWKREDVDIVIPHQASPHALAELARRCGFDPRKVIDIAATYGNQIAASLPTALDIARRTGQAGDKARVLMLGTSAGVSFGGLALQC